MKRRDFLSLIIKKDKTFHSIKMLDSKEKRDSFTKAMTNFIVDRNIYTHGKLMTRMTDGEHLIKYNEKKTIIYCVKSPAK